MNVDSTGMTPDSLPYRRIAPVLLAAFGLLFPVGCRKHALPEESNPYYVRGMKLLKERKHDEAAAAFEKCLRLEPDSAKAHLQLGMLHEDVYTDPVRAIHHYRCYLDLRPDGEKADAVKRWIDRAERAYLEDLLGRYEAGASRHPTAATRSVGKTAAPSPPSKAPPATAAPGEKPPAKQAPGGLTDRERRFVERIKELNDQVLALRRKLAAERARIPGGSARKEAPERQSVRTPSAAAPPSKPDRIHVVAAGDSLSKLSRKYYGHLKYWPLLRDYNRDTLRGRDEPIKGMRLRIPPLAKLTGEKGGR